MKNNIILDKSFDFAVSIVSLYKYLVAQYKEFVLSKQILRSGTAIGALVREAQHAESKVDFIHKLSIALKEANETEYWLLLLYKTNYLNEQLYNSLAEDIDVLIKLLVSIIETSKTKKKLL
jgi:four helix bundle protein